MTTTTWYVADTSGIQWARAPVPGTGGVLPVEVTRLGSEPPWTTWRLRRTAFEPGRVERWFGRQLQASDGALLAYVQDGDFAYLTALAGGAVVARIVVEEGNAALYEDGKWTIEQCTSLHGGAWREAALDRVAMWSHIAPREASVGTLREVLSPDSEPEPRDPARLVRGLFDVLGLPMQA